VVQQQLKGQRVRGRFALRLRVQKLDRQAAQHLVRNAFYPGNFA
jgi:hypothetical protein